MKRFISIGFLVLVLSLALSLPSFGAEKEKEKKTDETKISGTLVTSAEDPTGKLAPVVIETEKEQYGVLNNALGKKLAKYPGKKAVVTGKVQEADGKKVIEPWLFERQDPGAKKRRLPTE